MDKMEVLGTDTKDVLLATTAATAVLIAAGSDEAVAEVTNFGAFGEFGGSVLGMMLGGFLGPIAGAVAGRAIGSLVSTTDIGSSTPIGAYSQGGGGGGVFPSTAGPSAIAFGATFANFETSMRRYRVVFSKRTAAGTPSTSSNIKIGGSGGLIDIMRGNRNSLLSYLSTYRNSLSTGDRRTIALVTDQFLSNSTSPSPTSGGGVVRTDGCTDQFYTDIRTDRGLPSSRQAAVKYGCINGGFRTISHWGRDISHRSKMGVANARQAETKSDIAIGAEAIYQTVALLGTPTNHVAEQYARFTRIQLIPWQFMARLIWKVLDLIIRYGKSRSIIRRLAQDERDEVTTTAQIPDSMLDTLIEYVHDGIALTGVQRRDAGRKMTIAMSAPSASAYPAALNRNQVDVQQNVIDALNRTGDNEDIFVQLVQAYVDWSNGDDFDVLTWNSTTNILRRIY